MDIDAIRVVATELCMYCNGYIQVTDEMMCWASSSAEVPAARALGGVDLGSSTD